MDWLDEIEARARAATPGPWLVKASGDAFEPFDIDVFDSAGMYDHTVASVFDMDMNGDQAHADALFIATARDDIPRLIRTVRFLRGMVQDSVSLPGHLAGRPLEGPPPAG